MEADIHALPKRIESKEDLISWLSYQQWAIVNQEMPQEVVKSSVMNLRILASVIGMSVEVEEDGKGEDGSIRRVTIVHPGVKGKEKGGNGKAKGAG